MKKYIIIPVLALLFIFTGTAHAGFFDWFKNTPLNQEASLIKSLKSISAESQTARIIQLGSYKEASKCKGQYYETVTSTGTTYWCDTGLVSTPTTIEPVDKNQDSVVTFDKTIIYGAKGEEVEKLQQVLSEKGYLTGDIDGKYGPATRQALKEFQNDNGISANGLSTGSKTREALNDTAKTLPNLTARRGSSQICVPPTGTTPATAPWIQLLSPNGGESYTAGQQIAVKWESCNIEGNVRIQLNLFKNSYTTALAPLVVQNPYPGMGQGVNLTINDGQETVNLPSMSDGYQYYENFQSGNDFKVYIQAVDNSSGVLIADDYSDNYFKINLQGGPQEPSCDVSIMPAIDVSQTSTTFSPVSAGGSGQSIAEFRMRNLTTGCTIQIDSATFAPFPVPGGPVEYMELFTDSVNIDDMNVSLGDYTANLANTNYNRIYPGQSKIFKVKANISPSPTSNTIQVGFTHLIAHEVESGQQIYNILGLGSLDNLVIVSP